MGEGSTTTFTEKNAVPDGAARALSVEEWHTLAQEGIALPTQTLVNGVSMWPLVRRNRDVITVVPLQQPPRIGQIVLFPSPTRREVYVIHRVWRIDGARVQTLGDNCIYPDQWQPVQNMWGLVTDIARGARHIDPGAPVWRVYGRLCLWLRPLRPALASLRHAGGRLWHGVLRR